MERTRVLKRGKRRKENPRVDDPLAKIGGEDVDKVLPRRVDEAERRHQGVADDHEERPRADEGDQLPPARHDHPGD